MNLWGVSTSLAGILLSAAGCASTSELKAQRAASSDGGREVDGGRSVGSGKRDAGRGKGTSCPHFSEMMHADLVASKFSLDGGSCSLGGAQCKTENFKDLCRPDADAVYFDYAQCTCQAGSWKCSVFGVTLGGCYQPLS